MIKSIGSKYKIVLPAVVCLIIAGIVAAIYVARSKPVLPSSITKKAAFDVTTPDPKQYPVIRGSASYIGQSGVLSYKAAARGITYTVNEQAKPDSFDASPQVYPALLSKMQEYAEVQTSAGTVALTKPKELNGLQTAVLTAKSDLIFVSPSKNLSNEQWRDFFNSLEW